MKRYLLNLGLIAAFIFGGNVWGQTTVTWRTDGPSNGGWEWGSTCEAAGDGQWFYEDWGGFRRRPDCFGTHDVFFKGNGINTMSLNAGNFPVRRVTFESGATTQRTLNTVSSNQLRLSNNNGTPRIVNNSTTNHVFNAPIRLDNNADFRPNSGDLTFGAIDNNGNDLRVDPTSPNTVFLNGVKSGAGKLRILTNSTVRLNAANTYTGNTEIDRGELWIHNSGSIASASSIFLGNGGQLDQTAKMFLSRSDGGQTFSNNITVNNGNADRRFIGSLNTSGTNTWSGNITRNNATPLVIEVVSSGGTFELSGTILGSDLTGSVTKIGPGTAVFSSNQTYTGTTTISDGTLELSRDGGNTLPSENDISVENDATLRVTSNQTLNELTLNGTLHIAEGVTLTINTNLTTNAASIEGGGELIINGVWTNSGEETTIATNTDVVLRSTASGTAQYGNSSGTINGLVTVERFIPARSDGARAFRFLASPVSDVSIANSWQENMHVTGVGGATNGFDATDSNSSSMFTFNNDWVAVANTNVEFVHARAYRTFVRGDRTVPLNDNSASANDVTLSAKGSLATGDVLAPDMASGDHEFSFIGNPYQAVVDLASLGFGSGIENGFAYYWDPTLADNGSFVVINITANSSDVIPNPGSTQVNKFLQPGQAVFFRNTNASGDRTITFTEAAKRTGETQTAIFSETSIPYVNMRLYEAARFADGGKEQDAAGLRFFENGNNAVDSNDAAKMGNTSENFGLINSNQLLSIEQRAMPIEGEIFGLFTNNYQHSDYIFHINLQNFPEGLFLKLNDTHLNETHILEAGINEIPFSVDASLADSANSQRFNLEVGAVTLSVEDFQENSIELYPNPVANELNIRLDASMQASELSIYNIVGKQVMQVSLDASVGNHQVNTAQLSSGVYLVKVQTARGSFTSKLIKK